MKRLAKWLAHRDFNRLDGFWLVYFGILAEREYYLWAFALLVAGCFISAALEHSQREPTP
jgi:hypothetical protein